MAEVIETEVLIIGSGIAGCIPAILLAEHGIDVTVVTRSSAPYESNTYYAQGGIIYKGENDTPELLMEDLLRAGAGYSYEKAVRILAEEGPRLVEEILVKKLEVPFNRNKSNGFELALEGGHSLPRIIYVDDATGKAMEEALIGKLKNHPNIRLLAGYTAVDVLTLSHHSKRRVYVYEPETCVGAYLYDQKKRKVIRCLAKDTMLATGGLGQLYLRSTNPPGSRGDGLAMAHRAGARVINAEYVQFHPTTFYHEKSPPFLISEAVRGADARLVNANGEPFMQKYEPEWKDLAARDIVARSILKEMFEHDVQNVYLDLATYIPADETKNRFPNIYQHCLQYGIDISKDLVPVVPAAHYFCGGVWTDEWGQTTINNLYAVGEVACTGVHGANRLASSSLLEGLVWGYRAGEHITQKISQQSISNSDEIPSWVDTGIEDPDPALIQQDMNVIKHIMWNYVGLVRTTHRLDRALRELRHLQTEIEHFYQITRITDGLIGLRNAVQSALIIATAAWKNKTSVGCHYRE